MSWLGNWSVRRSGNPAAKGQPGFWFVRGKRRARTREDNPSHGLTISRAVRLMESYLDGDFADLMWTFGAPYTGIESSDADYLSIIERRQGALKQMNWQISRWKPDSDDKVDPLKDERAKNQAACLETAYERMENIYEAIAHLAMAKFRGFSILEPDEINGEFIPVDQWNVRRDGSRGDWFWNETAEIGRSLDDCDAFDPERIIVLETPRPIGRIALLKFIRANLSEQDWDSYVEIYGIPSGVVIAPDGVDEAQLAVFKAAAANASKGGDAAFPAGTQWTQNEGPRGIQPFETRLSHLSQKLVQAGTGGLLTMLSMAGSGTLAGSAHMEAFRLLARADARDVEEAFQKHFDKRKLMEHGLLAKGEVPLAWFQISAREEQDTGDATQQAVSMSQFFDLDEQQVTERTGWKAQRKAQPTMQPALGGMYRGEVLESQDLPVVFNNNETQEQEIAAALDGDLKPVAKRLDELMQAADGDLKAAAKALLKELPALAKRALLNPAAAALIETAMLKAAGLEEK